MHTAVSTRVTPGHTDADNPGCGSELSGGSEGLWLPGVPGCASVRVALACGQWFHSHGELAEGWGTQQDFGAWFVPGLWTPCPRA